jgi:ribonuclease D
MPQAIFDTQIASVFKKHGELAGFARVIQAELNVELAKSQTRTNWHARPLSEEQIEYALDDVRYLAPLYEKYLDELSQPQLDAVYEDCELLLDESLYKPDPHSAGSRIKNLKGLRPKNRAIVNTLAEWRETYAIENNQPKKWVMSDDVIVHIAKRPPKTVEALYKVPGIKSSSVKDYGSIWIELIDEVFSLDPENFPKPEPKEKKTDADEDRLISYLQSYINQVADDFNLNVNQLISKRQLLALVRREESLTGWRKLMIGEQIQQLLDGQACLKVENQQIKLIQNS